MADLLARKDQMGVGIPLSGAGLNIASGTFIGIDSAGNCVRANAHSGNSAITVGVNVPAVGFALIGEKVGLFGDLSTIQKFDAVDSPHAIGIVNSGSYTPGLPIYLSGNGLVNFALTPPTNRGDIVQTLGVMVDTTRFRVKIGSPFVLSGTPVVLNPWRGPGLT